MRAWTGAIKTTDVWLGRDPGMATIMGSLAGLLECIDGHFVES